MDHYIDIRLRADPDFPANMLMGALYNKLHRALVALHSRSIGVSLPEHELSPRTPGAHLRLHGGKEDLLALQERGWWEGMKDHVLVTVIQPAPEKAEYRVVQRIQPKTSVDRLQRRYMKRHSASTEEASVHYADARLVAVTHPFVNLRSQSTGQSFALFIAHGPVVIEPVAGVFSSYGLSPQATVPWF